MFMVTLMNIFMRIMLSTVCAISVLGWEVANSADIPKDQMKGNLVESALPAGKLLNPLEKPYVAPKIEGIQKWINSEPLLLKTLKREGKVVLIHFWTYSCINCLRTLPHIKNWHAKYKDKGLVIIGVHSPEFEIERNPDNVTKAVKDYGVLYPVAIDNDLKTWENFNNSYWPSLYLIDRNGHVVYTHFGEGEYDVTENNIISLLDMQR
jgi:thiol-disulfide isomerase/thioredoxin